jgi:deazaflavin-dependent oxidoreductase (nitroreductase family)
VSDYNRRLIDEFRATGGKVGGSYEGAPLLLLTTTGARSGRPHTTPLIYLEDGPFEDGGRLAVFATKGGAPRNPDWYHNLVALPDATIELGEETLAVRATVAAGEERDELLATQASRRPHFAELVASTTRQIPVVILERQE